MLRNGDGPYDPGTFLIFASFHGSSSFTYVHYHSALNVAHWTHTNYKKFMDAR